VSQPRANRVPSPELTSLTVKFRYPDDPLAPVPGRPAVGGLACCVDPVGFAAGVGERSVGFDRIVFHRVDSEQLPAK